MFLVKPTVVIFWLQWNVVSHFCLTFCQWYDIKVVFSLHLNHTLEYPQYILLPNNMSCRAITFKGFPVAIFPQITCREQVMCKVKWHIIHAHTCNLPHFPLVMEQRTSQKRNAKIPLLNFRLLHHSKMCKNTPCTSTKIDVANCRDPPDFWST